MVAAWIRADTGVGPAMASGSQMYRGIWADLPVAPRNSSRPMAVATGASRGAWCCMVAKENTPSPGARCGSSVAPIRNMPSRKPKSPMRLTTNAFLPAAALASLSNQKLISRYEQRPTPSQPTKSISRFSPSTRVIIAKMKRFR